MLHMPPVHDLLELLFARFQQRSTIASYGISIVVFKIQFIQIVRAQESNQFHADLKHTIAVRYQQIRLYLFT
jgi:hypothetical protein